MSQMDLFEAGGDLRYVNERTVSDRAGWHDVYDAIRHLRWVAMTCPAMPHEYVVRGQRNTGAYDVLATMVGRSPHHFRGYFRGYRRPNVYWEGEDGWRYWQTASRSAGHVTLMLNRCRLDDQAQAPRRVDEGAEPYSTWQGPPWAPEGSNLYEFDPGSRAWWPSDAAIAGGYQPCAACRQTWLKGQPR